MEGDSQGGKTIVVGYDGSDIAQEALRQGASMAGPEGKLFVVYAYSPPPDFKGRSYYNASVAHHQEHGTAVLESVTSEQVGGVPFETELLEGNAAEAIAKVAQVREAEHIVVGSHGHGGLRHALGGTSRALLHHADRPVLVIPRSAVEK